MKMVEVNCQDCQSHRKLMLVGQCWKCTIIVVVEKQNGTLPDWLVDWCSKHALSTFIHQYRSKTKEVGIVVKQTIQMSVCVRVPFFDELLLNLFYTDRIKSTSKENESLHRQSNFDDEKLPFFNFCFLGLRWDDTPAVYVGFRCCFLCPK